ncbi:LysE family translocator [Sulfitobacter sp. M57]|nr:LysE family translocator [Sulfitobacter sp. KE5]MDF3420767.1 LysE family translocator [Sulfitobacter sp. KE43]MDF3432498.1 LysE family translocator [Sulfitobacter sp. KE42]MDF3458137.1 LysE family translocator [Sulfitobacter sp. S74]MDF3462038.1 LysE family translocator [Sulfitobacter sp. Ks18]MDF3465939.1 LysE family translocator [Sulfitobacter sp. M05]MDF3469834.1 LysE family translocator [Sulfitobacter sp. M28]MDF3473580.1 LysE family translocator [Sulfitobacter sp. M48]MDF3477485.1 L
MTLANLAAFNAVLIVSILSPGAAFLMAVRSTVSNGRRAGIATGLGLGLMASLWTLAALLGLDALFAVFPWAFAALKIGGAGYLIYLAIATWRGAAAPVTSEAKPQGRSFLDGLLVNLGNPKAVLFAAAVLVVVFPADLSGPEIALVTLNHLFLEILFYTGCAYLLSAPVTRTRYLRIKPLLERTAALVLGGLGLKLLLQR